jgi:hypothetical protein
MNTRSRFQGWLASGWAVGRRYWTLVGTFMILNALLAFGPLGAQDLPGGGGGESKKTRVCAECCDPSPSCDPCSGLCWGCDDGCCAVACGCSC